MRRHLTYANVMATIAVFLALGGVSWAAVKLGPGAVKNRNIATGAVSSRAVQDRTLLARDFKGGQLAAAVKGESGLQGPAGPPGAAGRDGAAIVASANGDGTVMNSYNYVTLPLELRWTQPAGTLDEVRGVATVSMMDGCALNEWVGVQVVRDGKEISADTGDIVDGTGNGVPDNDATPFVTKPVIVTKPYVESSVIPIELPWSDTPGEHVVQLRVREACNASGQPPTFQQLRLWVVRAAR